MKISDVQIYHYKIPLKEPVLLKNRPLRERQGFLLRLVSDTGASGWGEAAPLPGISKESFGAVGEEFIRCADKLLNYRIPESYSDLEGAGLVNIVNVNSVSFAVESAYYNMMASAKGLPLHRYLNPNCQNTLHINALLSGSDADVTAKAATLNPQNAKAAKLKVGTGVVADDIKRVRLVREALDSAVSLRLDANRAWNFEDALEITKMLQDCNIEYIEEPLIQPFKLLEYPSHSSIPYALDETLQDFQKLMLAPTEDQSANEARTASQSLIALFEGAYACVWKPTIMHMPHMGEDIFRGTFSLPIQRLVLSAAFESGVGIANLAAYAAAFSKSEIPAGLDTYSWLEEDVLETPLSCVNGTYHLAAVHAAAQHVNLSKLKLLWAGSA